MAKKEDVVKIAEQLMNTREFIRNIGIVAHIDHGKCIAGSTEIFLDNGELIKARDLFEKESKGKPVKETENETVYGISDKNLRVLSFDAESREITVQKLTHAWKLKANEELIKLTLSTGQKIECTPEHKFYCVNEEGKIIQKEARFIAEKEFILAPKKTSPNSYSPDELKKELIELLSKEKGFFVRLSEKNGLELKRKILSYGMEKLRKEIDSPLKNKSFYHGVYNSRYRLIDFTRICGKLECQAYELIESINFRESLKKEGHSSIDLRLPKSETEFTELMYLLGLIWGDGGKCGKEIRITNNETEIIDSIHKICLNLFKINAKTRNYGSKATRIDLGLGMTFTKILEKAFDFPAQNKAYSISIPSLAKKSSNQLLKAFIQGYFDSDGTVEKARSAISISSASKKMISDLQFALLRFECIATFNEKKNSLYASGSNAKTFTESIGFRLKRKQLKAMELSRKTQSNRNTDLMPLSGKILREIRLKLAVPLKHYAKTQEAIERNIQGIYFNNFKSFINSTYSFVGNPKIKNPGAWNKVQEIEKTFFDCFTPFVAKIEKTKQEFVYDFTVENTHNFIANGVIISNTTMTDNLIAASGLMSQELAGKQLLMDSEDQEQDRGITINAANISIVYEYNSKNFLINIIDTPGHVDFGGEVIRAMRAVDGVILVVDAVEGVMPQTETVVRQALREYVKPVLFINKVDRLVNELKVSKEEMMNRFVKVIASVNELIKKNVPKEFESTWKVTPENGSVVFGSAYNNWAISVPQMQRTGVKIADLYDYCKSENQKELAKKSPLYSAVLEMVCNHLPNPIQAQNYRIPVIWHGDHEEFKTAFNEMKSCNKEGSFAMMVTDVSVDKHAGDIATGRVYAGKVQKGLKVKLLGGKREVVIQKVGVFMGPDFVEASSVPAGNIVALVGVKEVYAGETVSEKEMPEFESFMSKTEPVITVSVEAKSTKDLPKLIEVLRQLSKEDPNLVTSINQETGEHLLSGMGELHLEINQYRIEKGHNIPITVSTPIVVYHETILKDESPVIEAKSPNKHNKFKMKVEKLSLEIQQGIRDQNLKGKIKPKDKDSIEKLKAAGFSNDDSKRVWAVHHDCVLLDATKGIQALHEIRELVIQGFNDATDEGPLAKEKCQGVMVVLEDATLHEDAIHRGPAQVLPAITRGIYAAMLSADAVLLEPKQKLYITVAEDFMGAVSKELGSRRTQISEMRTEGDSAIIIAKAPVKELIGFSQAIRSATQGRALWTAEYCGYETLPRELQRETIKQVRTRKGMDPEPKNAEFFMD